MKILTMIVACGLFSIAVFAQDTLIGLDGQMEIIPDFKAQLENGVTDKITQLEFRDFDGRTVTIDSTYGRPFVINVWAIWCVPCVAEIPAFNKIKTAYLNCDVDFFAVSYMEDSYQTESFLATHPYHFKQMTASRDYVVSRKIANGLPTTIFVDKKGIVQYKIIGGSSDPDDQEETIDSFTIGLEKIGCITDK